MKAIILLCVLILAFGTGYLAQRASAPEVFGRPFQIGEETHLESILGEPDRYMGTDVRLSGKIVRQCPSAGCWFFLEAAQGKRLRVELGHLGLKFPQRVGRVAEVEGRLLRNRGEVELVGSTARFN
ncbi:MAG TPA: hypothetical protein PKO06_16045 [Candidatus Ozemobacteraceae bacterium]|nr:hypothetical protein [Candidatus Ozemobacteraceae bacterium]